MPPGKCCILLDPSFVLTRHNRFFLFFSNLLTFSVTQRKLRVNTRMNNFSKWKRTLFWFFIALITNCCNFLSKYFGTQIILGNNSVQKCTHILVMDWVLLETRVLENHQICRYGNYFAKNEDNFIIFPLLPDIPKNSISDTQTITTVHT